MDSKPLKTAIGSSPMTMAWSDKRRFKLRK